MKINKTGRLGVLLTTLLAMLAVSLPATASAKDVNKDKIPDRWEKKHDLTLKKDQRKLDQDKDGLKNRAEYRAGTDPRDKDSDDDGVVDGKERAGNITAYDAEAQTLTIALYGGGEISGSVTDRTRVKCQSEDMAEETPPADDESSDRHGRPGDDQSGAEDESGDESGDEAELPGHHGHPGKGHCGGNCSLEDLEVGAEVLEADVKFTSGGKVFTAIEIEKVATDDSEE